MSRSEYHLGLLDTPALCKSGKITSTQPEKVGRQWRCTLSLDFTIGDVGKARAESLLGEFQTKIDSITDISSTGLTLVSPRGTQPDNWARIVQEYRRKLAEKLNQPIKVGRREHRDGRIKTGKRGPSWNSPYSNPSTRR